jgi:hypothetical protein
VWLSAVSWTVIGLSVAQIVLFSFDAIRASTRWSERILRGQMCRDLWDFRRRASSWCTPGSGPRQQHVAPRLLEGSVSSPGVRLDGLPRYSSVCAWAWWGAPSRADPRSSSSGTRDNPRPSAGF